MSKNTSKVINLGCRLNYFESEVIENILSEKNLKNKIVINTCAVTNQAVQKSLREIRRAARKFPDHEIIVTGCASQVENDTFKNLEYVSRIIDNKHKTKPTSYEQNFNKPSTNDYEFPALPKFSKNRTRSTLQVQQGCNHRCTFCIIPFGRGDAVSLPTEEILQRVDDIIAQGYKEITLTGVDITSYGEDLIGKPKIGSILKRLFKTNKLVKRLRLSSIDPAEIDDDLLEILKSEEKLMPHLHFSLQSGDNLILKRMKRRHNREKIIELCQVLKQARPQFTFGADLIVGFPTETDDNFNNSLDLIEKCNFTNVHFFPFSPKTGTPASKMPQVSRKKVFERIETAKSFFKKLLKERMKKKVGKSVSILYESDNKSYTDDFFKVKIIQKEIFKELVGEIIQVKIIGIKDDYLIAEV
tara:strand:- start:1213 stop:2454 length:1242 start_codon:yes stop_codon:yes gene_type:complete